MNSIHITDSIIFGGSWNTSKICTHFSETNRIRGWIEIMVILAEVQAEFKLIPKKAAIDIRRTYDSLTVDEKLLLEVAADFKKTNHSFIGLINAIKHRCGQNEGEWLSYGVTVQDVTDTYMSCVLSKVRRSYIVDIIKIEKLLIQLAKEHRNTIMCGRTHGQPGIPITFGYKVATWLDEFDRHRQRLLEIEHRLEVVQLAGGVGSLSSLGPEALEVRKTFSKRLDLNSPLISWTSTRDRLSEWLNILAMITSTGDRIGQEIYNLQRPEIGELNEGFVDGTIGSITMPQKKNPEISEHLGTLSKTVRHHAAHMLENLVHDHERDGRSWKSEWLIIPEATMFAGKSLYLLINLLESLQVNSKKMLENIHATKGFIHAETIMLALAQEIGKQSAHEIVYKASMSASGQELSFMEVIFADQIISKRFTTNEIEDFFKLEKSTGVCAEMTDLIINSINYSD